MKMTYFQTSLRMISEWHLPQTRVKKYLLKEKILSGYNFRAINSLRIAAKQSDSSMKKSSDISENFFVSQEDQYFQICQSVEMCVRWSNLS